MAWDIPRPAGYLGKGKYLPVDMENVVSRVVLTPPKLVDAQWKCSGSAVEAQWKRSGCCCDLKQKKTGVPMTAPQNRPKILWTPHHLHLREFCVKLGRNRGNRPNFAPVAFLVGTTRVALRAAQRLLAAQPLHLCIILYNNVRLKNTSFVGCQRSGN